MPASPEHDAESSRPQPVLKPQISTRWALRWGHVVAAAIWALLFLLFSYFPLRSTDLWGHTQFGHWILEHRTLPSEDPLAPLYAGMQVIDSAWLSQVTLALVDRASGAEGLSILLSLVSLATLVVLARAFYLQSRRLLPMMVGVLCVIVVGWSRATTLRPETFGMLCFAVLLWLVTRDVKDDSDPRSRRATLVLWVAVPLLFCLWANLHGSYLVGIGYLVCMAVGRAIDVGWSTRKPRAALGDGDVQRYAFLVELALLASLVNPYGGRLLMYNLQFAGHPNLETILEWQPLVLTGIGGREFVVSLVLLLFLWRQSRAKVSATQVLLLAVFGLAAIDSVRMLAWYAVVFAWSVVPHVAEVWSRWLPAPAEPEVFVDDTGEPVIPPGRSFYYTLVAGLLLWLGFSFSPLGTTILGGKPRSDERLYDEATSPLGIVAFLEQRPPIGLAFQPQQWGDWLVRRVPGYRPFVTSNIHLAPRQVWSDYLRIHHAQPGWQRVLQRYNVDWLILDKSSQPLIVQAMKQTTGWVRRYEDDQAVIYERLADAASRPATSAEDNLGGERAVPETEL